MHKSKFLAVAMLGAVSTFAGAAPFLATPALAQTETVEVKAPAGVYKLDPTHSALLWSLKHLNVSNYTGRFANVQGTLNFDPANISASSIEVTIDPKSVQTAYPADYKATHARTGFESWNEDISRNQNFLNSDKFPEITFKSTKVEQTGPRTAKIIGDLTLLGVSKSVTLDASFNGELDSHPFLGVPVLGFAAEGKFDRTEFGQKASGALGNEITVRFDGEFIQQKPEAK